MFLLNPYDGFSQVRESLAESMSISVENLRLEFKGVAIENWYNPLP
jgi:hypothetical protein